MVPVDDMDDDDSAFLSDDSENSATLTRRSDAPPMRHEIQSAIEQGDWAAVGATAAILAPKPDEDSASMGNTTHTSEMEALVNSGNWSGIVAVAARYADDASITSGPLPSDHGSVSSYHRRENSISSASVETADESSAMTQSHSNRSSQISNATDSVASSASFTGDSYTNTSYSGTGTSYSGTGTYSSRTGTYETGTSEEITEISREQTNDKGSSLTSSRSPIGSTSYANPSTLTSVSSSSDNRDDKQRISAYRAEVEALVRRVVPDEIDNVDAIMIQFSGREEELIATLRGMQEKTIAQRAKAAVQRSAKKEAKTGGRIPDDYTASSEEQSSVRDSSYTASSALSAGDMRSMASTVDGRSITEEFADDSSHSGSESESEYTAGNVTEEGSRSEYSRSDYSSEYSQSEYSRSASEYTSRSESHSSGDQSHERSANHNASAVSSLVSKEPPDELDGLMDSGDWHGIADHARQMRRARERDLD